MSLYHGIDFTYANSLAILVVEGVAEGSFSFISIPMNRSAFFSTALNSIGFFSLIGRLALSKKDSFLDPSMV